MSAIRVPHRTAMWPDGQTWAFQGSVGEDATVGTHICTLTVTPGAGNEMQVLRAAIQDGNTATSQTLDFICDDGTNVLNQLTTSSTSASFFQNYGAPQSTNDFKSQIALMQPYIVSGTMRLILKVTTTAISVTQTFAVVCRIYGGVPTATLADTVGAPTLTTNTSQVF